MKSAKLQGKLLVACIALISSAALLKAGYYKSDFFPIGLTGLNFTGYDWPDGCPYGNTDVGWGWDSTQNADYNEKALIFSLGVNCIGCSDAYHHYLMSFGDGTNNYLHKVCKSSFDTDDTIFLIPLNYYVKERYIFKYKAPCCNMDSFTVETKGASTTRASTFFRSPHRPYYLGWGDPLFSVYNDKYDNPPYDICSTGWECHGTRYDNYEYEGNEYWRKMADTAIYEFGLYLDTTSSEELACIWGWNLLTEEPAISRHNQYDRFPNDPWRGCWAASKRILTGFREAENGTNHMIVAKYGTSTLHRGGYNIFDYLPDIDAFMVYSHYWTQPYWNYGSQTMFDYFLYGDPSKPEAKGGRHNVAIYFQQYGNSPGRSGQKRRWFATIDLAWYTTGRTWGASRRPCPPEIRCASYLSLSRGAKGIFFHGWTFESVSDEYPNVTIPCSSIDLDAHVGIRDHKGFPFGYTNSPDKDYHYLNNGQPSGDSTHWYEAKDTTYNYLANHLVDEIKEVGKVLVQLDWVNAYSLKSTVTGKGDDCSHMYVKDITTTGEGYIDLAFFDDTAFLASEYFMVVNRDGITDNVNCTLTIKLDGSGWSNINRLIVKNMADTTDTFVAKYSEGYVFTDTFSPGEGKLYKVSGPYGNWIPVALLLTGEWRQGRPGTQFMGPLAAADTSLGWAYLHWRWLKDKPATLEGASTWQHICGETGWNSAYYSDIYIGVNLDRGGGYGLMLDSCMYFLRLGEHPDGKDTVNNEVGTKSNEVQILHPGSIPQGCPDLYSFFYQDTSVSPGHVFMENNTILPHSQHVQAIDEDLLKLDVLNTEPDHYYLSIVENDDEISYLDQVKLWVVDHDEDEQVATSADDSIYVYSDMVGPASCTDRGNNDRLDQILWEDTASFAGPANSYLTVKFSDPGWTYAGLLISLGDRSETAPPPKDYLSIPSEPGGGGTWDSLGVAYGRMNPSQWLVDVSDCDSLTFRVYCYGDDTCFIDRIALVKLEPTGWSLTEAVLDSAVLHYKNGTNELITAILLVDDTFSVQLIPNSQEQISLRFDKVDTSATYPIRDFVFQSRGYYIPVNPPGSPRSGVEEEPLEFGITITQIEPLSQNALINYSVPYQIHVKIGIYDVSGRLVRTVVNDKVNPGRYSEQWLGIDNAGRRVASGIYFIKMETEDYKRTHKIVVLK